MTASKSKKPRTSDEAKVLADGTAEPLTQVTLKKWWMSYGIAAILLGMCVGFIFWQALAKQYQIGLASDYPTHIERAQTYNDGKPKDLTHPLFQWIIIAVQSVTQSDFPMAGLNSGLLLYVVIGSLIYLRIMWPTSNESSSSNHVYDWVLGGIAVVALMLANPITSFTLCNSNLYFGYAYPNVYHNPTMLALKPFALLAFWQTGVLIESKNPHFRSFWLRLGMVLAFVVISALAKPSFIMIFLPALGILAFFLLVLKRPEAKNAWILFITCSVAGMAVLVLQLMELRSVDQQNTFAFAPFKTSHDTWGLILVKILMSTAFPLSVIATFRGAATRHWRLPFAWLAFLVGWAIANLFVEDGPNLLFRNFTWCEQIGIFILFVESFAFLREQLSNKAQSASEREFNLRSAAICLCALACHVTSGIAFYMLYVKGLNVESVY